MSGLQKHMNHSNPCSNCGYSRAYHDKERVYSNERPGHYHYEYTDCPEGNGTFDSGGGLL